MVGLQKARQESLLPRLPAPPRAFARPLHRRAGHPRPGDERVHAAVVSVRVQGDQGPHRRHQGHRPRQGQAEVRAGEAPRPRRPHDRHPRVLGRRVSARPLLRRSCSTELRHVAPSQVEEDGDRIIVRHLYIERRMTPLNLFLEARRRRAAHPRGARVRRRDPRTRHGQHLRRATCCSRISASRATAASCSTTTTRSSTWSTAGSGASRRRRRASTRCRATSGIRSGRSTSFPRNSRRSC